MKTVRCFWRTDRTCPHPPLCHYGYDCVAKPKGRAMSTFVCPVCGEEWDTLMELLTCCPRELRTMTANLERQGSGMPTVKDLTSGHVSAATREALLFSPATEERPR